MACNDILDTKPIHVTVTEEIFELRPCMADQLKSSLQHFLVVRRLRRRSLLRNSTAPLEAFS